MSVEKLAREVNKLRQKLTALQGQRPAHDTRGLFERQLMEVEDELEEKQQAFASATLGIARRRTREGEG